MMVEEFVNSVFQYNPNLPPKNFLDKVHFKHNGKEDWGESDDLNSDFRKEVVNFLFEKNFQNSRAFIKYLLGAEIEYCREETLMRESLRKLTFMLYSFYEMEDIPQLFEAKMNTSFDASCSLDIELIFGKNKEEVKEYFNKNRNEDYDIVGCIEEYEKYEHRSPIQFNSAMNSYYQRK